MNVFMWRWDPDFRDFALYSPLAELGASLLEAEKVSLFYDQAFVKEPGTREVTQWHQDMPFWPALGFGMVYGAAIAGAFALAQGQRFALPTVPSWWAALLYLRDPDLGVKVRQRNVTFFPLALIASSAM